MQRTLSQLRLTCQGNTRGRCVRHPRAKPLELWLAASRRPVGTPPPPRAVPAVNGQLGFSSNRRHPSPDRGLPALLPSQGGEPEDRRANKPQGASLTLAEGAAPDAERGVGRSSHRTPPQPGTVGWRPRAWVPRPLCSRASAGGVRAPETLPPDRTSFFTFHSSFSLTASSALPMVRQVAARRHQEAPRAPVRPHRLRASRLSAPRARRSPRPLHSPPAAAAATARCSAPQPSSEPRRRQAAGPAPSHSRQGGGVCAATGEGGVRAGADAWGRRARARAAGMVVMATGPLPPRGREPAL